MKRILIVDDKPENLYLLRALLQGSGYPVDEARHGAEALVKARQAPPDLIISDLLMPVMDGYTLLRHWKADARLKEIPFVVYTATYTDPQDEKLALDLGADAFILKPAEPEPFLVRVQEVLTRQRTGGLTPTRPPFIEEKGAFKEYSEVLIRKLEQKAEQLEQANRRLEEDIKVNQVREQKLKESGEQLRALLARLQRTREEERIRVSREIHDELGQLLTGLKMDVCWLERKLSSSGLPAALHPLLERAVGASALADATIATVQKIAADLRPSALDQLGLVASLAQEARRWQERNGVPCQVAAGPWPVLPPATAGELFYICQETLTNVARHANAKSVTINLTTENGAAVLEVCDDGVGIAETDLNAPRSLGLLGIRERAAQCGGTVTFTRNKPRGTRVTVRVPAKPE